ncbi:OmpA family protein [Candidatus Accumulibacter sp. ACC003]|uniref:OmpA family protein n=1 Tax=Candidatus Accumulibacter sp. ACC003 TaxID=2823334 RepID=UPI0025C02272|nr:OmpA family protein [Candidatus Accumulibacter sp. ACC003]
MNRTAKKITLVAVLGATLGFGASLAQAQTSIPLDRVYVIDSRGEVAMSGAGLCWRTGFWTPAGAAKDPAGCKCDKDLLPKEVCEPPMAAAAPAAAGPKPSGDKITVAADALFDFNKATLRPLGKSKLDEVVAMSKQIKLEVIIAVGHTDRIGSDAYNQKLSERRAASVKTYLVSKGVEANRVYTEGKGEKQPVTKPGQCAGAKSKKVIECLQPDRRVDIELIGTK